MAIVYHASPRTDLQVIDPNWNNEGKVFATQFDMAHAFLGRAGRGLVMGQRRDKNNIPVFTEKLSGAFNYRYRSVDGAIYSLDGGLFIPSDWREEVVSHTSITPIGKPIVYNDVRAKLLEMEQDGQIIIEWWTGRDDDQAVLNYWLGQLVRRPKDPFVIENARAFLEHMRPHLREAFERSI